MYKVIVFIFSSFLMIAFSFFGLHIYWYGLFYGISFLFGYLFLYLIVRKSILSHILPSLHIFLSRHMDDLFLYAVLGLLIGGRVGHILIYDFSYYMYHPLEIFMIWKGGMSFIGGIIGVIISLLFLIRKYNLSTIDLFSLGDLLFIPTTFGITIGRIGNFLNQELYGIPVSDSFLLNFPTISYWFSKLSFFYIYSSIDTLLRLNTNFLSSLFEGLLLFIVLLFIFFIMKKRKLWQPGLIVGIFFIWYSVVRFFFEYLRADSQLEFIGRFTKSQWFFFLSALIAILFLILRKRIFFTKK